MDIELNCDGISVEGCSARFRVDVKLLDVSIEQILDQIEIDKVVRHYGLSELCDAIGEGYVKDYFGLMEKE